MNQRIARKIMNDRFRLGRYSERQIQAAARRLGEWTALRLARAIVASAASVEIVAGRVVYRWDSLNMLEPTKGA